MNIYKTMAIAGIYMMTLNPINSNGINKDKSNYNKNKTTITNELKDNKKEELTNFSNTRKQEYMFVVSVGDINPTEGVGIQIINNKDTLNIQTNYIGIALTQAYMGDTVKIYPTEKSGQFKSLEMVLKSKFNNIIVEPESTSKMTLK